uniref:PRELI/MSF1 domain-containing protein n=1 Tax=Nomascus leucogenys TaxID=61853 RepID=A0A2I3GU84_NOMLE
MVKYFLGQSMLRSSWDQVFAAFWQRYPNPYSKHVLTEDIVHGEVTPDQKLLSRRLLTKTNRMPRWAEQLFPANVDHSVYILEDSIVDPQNQTMTTFTWNINHARPMWLDRNPPGSLGIWSCPVQKQGLLVLFSDVSQYLAHNRH